MKSKGLDATVSHAYIFIEMSIQVLHPSLNGPVSFVPWGFESAVAGIAHLLWKLAPGQVCRR